MKHIQVLKEKIRGTNVLRKKVATENSEPSKTDQSQLDETDVNNIIRKFTKTGRVSHLAKNPGQYGDYTNMPDLLTAFNAVHMAKTHFEHLPAHLRQRFINPENMIEWLQNPHNDKEAVELGLKILIQPPSPEEDAPKAQPSGVKPSKKVTQNTDSSES